MDGSTHQRPRGPKPPGRESVWPTPSGGDSDGAVPAEGVGNERDHCQAQEHEEQDLGRLERVPLDQVEPEQAGDQGDDQEREGHAEHRSSSLTGEKTRPGRSPAPAAWEVGCTSYSTFTLNSFDIGAPLS